MIIMYELLDLYYELLQKSLNRNEFNLQIVRIFLLHNEYQC